VVAARENDTKYLGKSLTEAKELGEKMVQLYHSMDNSLRFKCEAETGDKATEVVKDAATPDVVHHKDLRGVACPMNFVKTKVELARIKVDQRLEILLDDGEPIDNVPRSVKTEGHEIISQEKVNGHWLVVIEKKA